MMKPTTSQHACPTCRGPVIEQRRDLDTKERAAFFFADLPFLLVFGLCVAVGMWQWIAGVVAFAVTLLIFYRWHRARFHFRCYACDASFEQAELQPADQSAT
jgi:hypothetical protein